MNKQKNKNTISDVLNLPFFTAVEINKQIDKSTE